MSSRILKFCMLATEEVFKSLRAKTAIGRTASEMSGIDKLRSKEIWAIGGGKGGTGKSFITSSIGIYLASRGKKVLLVDADLGGANLHSFLGVTRPRVSLTRFFEERIPIPELILETGIENLGLVTGDLYSLDSGGLKYAQRLRFFRAVRSLEADYVLIDLGAGISYKTIDSFLMADKMIVVMVPEVIAIENMYQFIKNVVFRRLRMVLNHYGFRELFQEIWRNRRAQGIRNLKDLMTQLRRTSLPVREILDKEFSRFCIHLALNQIRNSQEIRIGSSVRSVFLKCFDLCAKYAGYIAYNECIWRSVNYRQPFMLTYASSRSAQQIGRIADNILNGGQIMISRN